MFDYFDAPDFETNLTSSLRRPMPLPQKEQQQVQNRPTVTSAQEERKVEEEAVPASLSPREEEKIEHDDAAVVLTHQSPYHANECSTDISQEVIIDKKGGRSESRKDEEEKVTVKGSSGIIIIPVN